MRTRDMFVAATSVLLTVAVVVFGVILLRSGSSTPPPRGSHDAPHSSGPVQPKTLAVKIDNVPRARPQTGLGAASTVYVEPVEGGLTRLAAVYTNKLPQVVGPVRSARETDVSLLAQYGRPTLAYSGAAPELSGLLARASLVHASPKQSPGAYFRNSSRPMPHNLYVRPSSLPQRVAGSTEAVLRFGPAPAGGAPARTHRVSYRGASYDFTWTADQQRWLVHLNGTPLTSTEAGQLGAGTVVVQRVAIRGGRDVVDSTGNPSPVAVTTGSGEAAVLRDGRRFDARWSRPGGTSPTRLSTTNGEPLPMAPGPVWILLVPK